MLPLNKKLFPGRASDVCSYKGCENRRDVTKLFRFPTTDVQRREKWIQNCANTDLLQRSITSLVKSGVCAVHFAKDDFLTPDRLKSTATPVDYKTWVLNNSSDIMKHDQTGIDDSLQPMEHDQPRLTDTAIDNLLKRVSSLEKENYDLRKELRALKKRFMIINERENRAKVRAERFTRSNIREIVISLSDLSAAAKTMISLQLHTANAPFWEEEKNLAK